MNSRYIFRYTISHTYAREFLNFRDAVLYARDMRWKMKAINLSLDYEELVADEIAGPPHSMWRLVKTLKWNGHTFAGN